MQKILICCIAFWIAAISHTTAQTPLVFNNWDSLLQYAADHSYTKTVGEQQQSFAKAQRMAAIGNTLNPRIPTTFSITDNTDLPVSFLPAETFGGAPGTFREVTMGQEYITSFAMTPQLDVVNPAAIAKIKSAKITEDMTAVNNELTHKNLLESVNAVYHNILSVQTQQAHLQQSLYVADSILHLVEGRYTAGVARSQEVNEAKVNRLNLVDRIEQMGYSLEQQYLQLRLLCDIPAQTDLSVTAQLTADTLPMIDLQAGSQLAVRYAQLQHTFAKAEHKASHWAHLPVISFVSSVSWQNNSNNHFFDGDSKWINANYWGFRLNYNLPTDVQKLTNERTTQINLKTAAIQLEHTRLQNDMTNKQLETDYRKALSQLQHYQQINLLKQDNYLKSRNQYEAEILPLDKLLLAYNEVLNAELAVLNAQVSLQYAKAKVELANRF